LFIPFRLEEVSGTRVPDTGAFSVYGHPVFVNDGEAV
jgi:hypothetical protein